jgi:hypothetical protein
VGSCWSLKDYQENYLNFRQKSLIIFLVSAIIEK